MFAVDINTGANELLEEIIKDDCKHSRIPVYDETLLILLFHHTHLLQLPFVFYFFAFP